MSFDLSRTTKWLEAAAKPLVPLLSLGGAAAAGLRWLKPRFETLVPADVALVAAMTIPALAVGALLLLAAPLLGQKSRLLRPERFDHRVRKPADLVGRERDIADLQALLRDHNLVFLDGESGSGKSALLRYGLCPALREAGASLPVLITEYSGDWDDGLARQAYLATWEALTAEDRGELSAEWRPAIGQTGSARLLGLLTAIGDRLGKVAFLVLDQFDDYQLSHQASFVGPQGAWISVAALKRSNSFWRAMDNLLAAGRIKILVAARSDTTAGLHSVRMPTTSASRTLGRLDKLWLVSLLGQVTADDGRGAVVDRPDDGWMDVQALLEEDLKAEGALLPQQIRVALLGLRLLPRLTPTHYRRAGGARGLESTFLRDTIKRTAEAASISSDIVRALLLRLIDGTDPVASKTVWRGEADLEALVPDQVQLHAALDALAHEEVVRSRPGIGGGVDWHLDHDYLVRGVLAESRSAVQLAQALREGDEAWSRPHLGTLQRFGRLLTVRQQAKMALARLRYGSTFRYAEHRAYAAWSLVRITPLVLTLAVSVAGLREWRLHGEARAIVDGLYEESDEAVIALWRADRPVRSRALRLIVFSPDRISTAGEDWPYAFVSLEPEAARELVGLLVGRLQRLKPEEAGSWDLIAAMDGIAPRLDPKDAGRFGTEIRQRWRAAKTVEEQDRYLTALMVLAQGMAPAEARRVALEVLPSFQGNPGDERSLSSAIQTYYLPLIESLTPKERSDLLGNLLLPVQSDPSRLEVIATENAIRHIIPYLDSRAAYRTARQLLAMGAAQEDSEDRLDLSRLVPELTTRMDPPRAAYFIRTLADDPPGYGGLSLVAAVLRRADVTLTAKDADGLAFHLLADEAINNRQGVRDSLNFLAPRMSPQSRVQLLDEILAQGRLGNLTERLVGALDQQSLGKVIDTLALQFKVSGEGARMRRVWLMQSVAGKLSTVDAARLARELTPEADADDWRIFDFYELSAIGGLPIDPRAAATRAEAVWSNLQRAKVGSAEWSDLVHGYGVIAGVCMPEVSRLAAERLLRLADQLELEDRYRSTLALGVLAAIRRMPPDATAVPASRLLSLLDRLDDQSSDDLDTDYGDVRERVVERILTAAEGMSTTQRGKLLAEVRKLRRDQDIDLTIDILLQDFAVELIGLQSGAPLSRTDLHDLLATIATPAGDPDSDGAWKVLEARGQVKLADVSALRSWVRRTHNVSVDIARR